MKNLFFIFFAMVSILFANQDVLKEKVSHWIVSSKGFEKNLGQVVDFEGKPVENVYAILNLNDFSIFMTKKGASFVLYQKEESPSQNQSFNRKSPISNLNYARFDLELLNSDIRKENIEYEDEIPGYTNYYLPSSHNGILCVKNYRKVRIKNVYQGIDWVFKDENGEIHHQFEVEPLADVSQIKMKVKWADVEEREDGKKLVFNTPIGKIEDGSIYSYEKGNRLVDVFYKKGEDGIISFEVKNYSGKNTLIIDPPLSLLWATYYGGSDDEWGYSITTDGSGNVFVTGYTSSTNFPTQNPGGNVYFQGTNAGEDDAFILKYEGRVPEVTLIPVVASAHGARSSNWITDLQIFNLTEKIINFTFYLVPPATDGTKTPYVYTSTIEPKKLKIFKDIVSQVFQLPEMSGALQIVPDGKLIATARVYNQTENGTYGQFVKGYNLNGEDAKYIIRRNEVGHIIHLTNSILFRTNIGFVEVLGKNVTVNLSIYDDFNNLLGSSSYNLLPMGFLQVNDVFSSLGISGFYQSARAEITVEGEGAVFVYGSIVDNTSNDAIFVPTLKEVGNLKEQSIGVAVHKEGDKGTFWRSDLRVFNLSEEEQEVTFNFMESGKTYTKKVSIAGKNIMNANDALQQIFELNDNYGNMEITAPNGILATSRIYTTLGKQTYGQFVPSSSSHNPIRLNEFQYLLHLSQNESFRTNVGLSEVSGKSATVEITLYDKNGNELGSGTVLVQRKMDKMPF